MVRDLPEAEENLPEAHRDLQDRDPPEAVRDLPAVDREPELRTDRRECLPKQRAAKKRKKGYHLWHRDRSDPVHGSIIVSGNDSYQQ